MVKNSFITIVFMSLLFVTMQSNAEESNQSLIDFILSNAPTVTIGDRVKELVAQGADVNKVGGPLEQTPLMVAIERYYVSIPLYQGFQFINMPLFETIFDTPGIDVNVQDKNGKTALMYYIEKRDLDFGGGPVTAYVQKSETAMLYVQRRNANDGQDHFLGHISHLPLYLGGTTYLDNDESTKKLWFGLNYEFQKNGESSKSTKDVIEYFEKLTTKNK